MSNPVLEGQSAGASHPILDPVKAPPFPEAAFTILRNTQLRKNVAHATDDAIMPVFCPTGQQEFRFYGIY